MWVCDILKAITKINEQKICGFSCRCLWQSKCKVCAYPQKATKMNKKAWVKINNS